MTREEREKAIEFFKFHRKMFCEDYLKKIPKDSIAYQATLKEISFYDMAIKALEQTSPCDLCLYNPPSSGDGKPCSMCPACSGGDEE